MLLEEYRAYLRVMARRQLDSRIHARVDASDVVQQTFLEAHRDFAGFCGQTEEEWMAWLQRILHNNVAQSIQQHIFVQKRTVDKEKSLDDSKRTGHPLRDALAVDQSSPSQRAMRGENAVRLAQAIETLPDDQREAIRLRHLEGWPLARIAEHFGRTEVAVAGLLKRGLKRLKREFPDLQ